MLILMRRLIFLLLTLSAGLVLQGQNALRESLPRTADGKPNFEGIWQASSTANSGLEDHVAALNILAGRSVLKGGGSIPYLPAAAKQRAENFRTRQANDPFNKCYIAGVPRIMYLEYPFQIFQTPSILGMAFEWELEYRLIYTDGSPHPATDEHYWMGDSRGHWEGDTLVVDVANHNEFTWLDKTGNFHSDALHVVERYKMTGRDTIQYEATLEDPKVFSKPWTIQIQLERRKDRDRLYEYVCEAENEEVSGAFERETKTWFPGDAKAPAVDLPASTHVTPAIAPVPGLKRTPEGKPDLTGFYESQSRGANQGLDRPRRGNQMSLVVDPPDGRLPMQPWAQQEKVSRNLPERGYDDPTAHCFPPGTPRALWIPEGFEILQTKDYLFMLFERTSWRIIDLKRKEHLPDSMRLWQGDSIGHWEGDTLVIETTNNNGKTWLNEGGEILSHAEKVVERITPSGPSSFAYEATVYDPVVYNKPWTVAFPINREKFQLREAACLEEEHDLPHLKALKDAAAAKKK